MKTQVILACLAVLIACAAVQVTGTEQQWAENRQKYWSSSRATYLALYRQLSDRLEKVERRRCESGYKEVFICDPNFIEGGCTLEYVLTGEPNVEKIPIYFKRFFYEVPTATAGLSGIFSSTDKNCTVEATDVTHGGFNIKIVLGGIYPFKLRMFWFACEGDHITHYDY